MASNRISKAISNTSSSDVVTDEQRAHFGDRVAAITGAGSGIGQALAIALARTGCHLALSDIDGDGLAETVARCEGHAVKVTAKVLDVSDREAVFAWADEVVEAHDGVHFIFNNAGVALGSSVETTTHEDFAWLMDVNFWGVIHGTQAFLPKFKAAGAGHVVNISSVFGLLSIPTQSAYNAAKFGVRGFTDALRMELEIEDSPVSATTIHPGGIKTNIVRNGRFDEELEAEAGGRQANIDEFERTALTTPDKAAQQILQAVRRNRRRALIGPDAIAFDAVSRLPAALSQRLLVGIAKRRQ